jgi:pimeloyl-ACP methyl ester carboxylesterase
MTYVDKNIKLKDGRRLGYTECGDPNGKPLFYFHGWPGCRLDASFFDEECKSIGIKIIGVDRPGYGLSDPKPNRSLLEWANDIEELANQLNYKTYSVMGVSGGCPYALATAFKNPRRVEKALIVSGLGPIGETDFPERDWSTKLVFDFAPKHRFFLKGLAHLIAFVTIKKPEIYVTALEKGVSEIDKDSLNKLAEMTEDIMSKTRNEDMFRKGTSGLISDCIIYNQPWGFDISKIEVPIRIWYGTADNLTPHSMGEFFHNLLPNSKLELVEGEGHFMIVNKKGKILKSFVTK